MNGESEWPVPCFTTFLDIFELMAISSTNSSTPPLFIYSLQPLSGPHTAIAALLLFFHYSIILIVIALLYCQYMLPSFKRAFSTHQPIQILICTFNQFWNTLPASVYPFFFQLVLLQHKVCRNSKWNWLWCWFSFLFTKKDLHISELVACRLGQSEYWKK